MYVVGYAKKALKIGKGDTRTPGDEVPEADEWKPHVLQAHTSLQWLQTKEQYQAAKSAADAHDKKLKVTSAARRKVREEAKKKLKAAQKAEKDPETEPPEQDEVPGRTPSTKLKNLDQPLEEMNKSQLKKLAKERGLKVGGTKEELVGRLNGAGESEAQQSA